MHIIPFPTAVHSPAADIDWSTQIYCWLQEYFDLKGSSDAHFPQADMIL